MYIKDKNLVIECDEYNHYGRDESYERTREENIKSALKCKFIRFNPDDINFKLASLISTILDYCEPINT
jgi:very-short-patch-repair endonuclease